MAGCEDLWAKAKANAASLKFEEACKLAECAGFVFARQRGTSHRMYKRPKYIRMVNLQPDRSGMAKRYQVQQLLDAIDELGGLPDQE